MKFLVFGDMGFTNSQSLKGLIAEAEAKEFPYGIDVGDFGYNLNTNNGTIGDKYFIQNQPIYAATPFIVCPGFFCLKFLTSIKSFSNHHVFD